MNSPWLRKPAEAVATVEPAGSRGWMRADSAVLLASREVTFTFSEFGLLAGPADGASAPSLVDALDFPVTGGRVAPSPDVPMLPCPF